jgi:serine/threonine protein phosphatase PrpC
VNFINEELYLLKKNKNSKDKNDISKKLANYAVSKGSTDNISLIIIYL